MLSNPNHPLNQEGLPFLAGAKEDEKRQDLEKNLREYLVEDPEIRDATNLSAAIVNDGGKSVVQLIGKLQTQKEKDRAEELVRNNVPQGMGIDNQIVAG
jgi:hypothetical protein